MSLTRLLRSYFTSGTAGPSGTKWKTQNKPTEAEFQKLFESVGIIADQNDAATELEQGFVKLETDDNAKVRAVHVPPIGTPVKTYVVRPHQLTKLEVVNSVGTVTETSDTDSVAVNGYGIRITAIKKMLVGGLFRRNFRIENTMDMKSADGSITPTQTATGWNLKANLTTGPVGPTGAPGENTPFLYDTTNYISVVANSAGVVASYVGAESILRFYDETGSEVDLGAAITAGDLTIASHTVGTTFTLTAEPLGLGAVLALTNIIAGLSMGVALVQMVYLGDTYSRKVGVGKTQPGTNGTDGTDGVDYTGGPSTTYTLTAAGLTQNLTNSDNPYQIIRGNVTLIGNVAFTHSGLFSDGQTFTFLVDTNTHLNARTFTIFGKSLTAAEVLNGNQVFLAKYDGTLGDFEIQRLGEEVDSGWKTINGFAHMSAGLRPKYRVLGKMVIFKGRATIPLDDGAGNVVSYNSEYDYATQKRVTPFTGAGGVLIGGTDQSLSFNSDGISTALPVIPNSEHFPDDTYTTGWFVNHRRVLSNTANTYITYSTMVYVGITASGTLYIDCIRDIEYPGGWAGPPADLEGNSSMRYLSSKATTGDYALNYTDVTGGTLQGVTAAAHLALNAGDQAVKHDITIDAAKANHLGGFEIHLDGLIAYLT